MIDDNNNNSKKYQEYKRKIKEIEEVCTKSVFNVFLYYYLLNICNRKMIK